MVLLVASTAQRCAADAQHQPAGRKLERVAAQALHTIATAASHCLVNGCAHSGYLNCTGESHHEPYPGVQTGSYRQQITGPILVLPYTKVWHEWKTHSKTGERYMHERQSSRRSITRMPIAWRSVLKEISPTG